MTDLAGTAERIRGLLVAVLLVGGCASDPSTPPPTAATDTAATCRAVFRALDERISAAGIRDGQSAPVPEFPYLRIDRLHAALAPEATGPAFDAWVARLRDLDRRARRLEIANLPSPNPAPAEDLDECAEVLRARDLSDPQRRAALVGTTVKDAYQPWLRVLGLYPATAVPFLFGVRNLHRETARAFATPLDDLPREGELTRYVPAPGATLDAAEVAMILARAAANPLAIPDPEDEDLQALFETFAPRFDIDSASAADLPGRPVIGTAAPTVAGQATVFTLRSFVRWRGQTLLQLNYVLWFPARPRESRLDLVSGNLDGITWRVTLGMDGRPLLFDSMHNCGCYHKVFPTRRVVERRPRGFEEPLSVPQTAPEGSGAMVLRISAGRHYLQRLDRVQPQASSGLPVRTYAFADYDELRTLPRPGGGSRSLFRSDGIVAGTERRERWVFWPMGVPEPGAMRQWGHHAIAFVGRRHFDDPGLLERYFRPAEDAGESADR
ncbi:MAG: hypothetical protein RIC56_23425 [Pseudomonadales bacterium]